MLPGIFPNKLKMCVNTKTCTGMFSTTLVLITKNTCKQPRCPLVGEWMNETVVHADRGPSRRWTLTSHKKKWAIKPQKRCGGTLNAHGWVKEASLKRLKRAQFQLQDIFGKGETWVTVRKPVVARGFQEGREGWNRKHRGSLDHRVLCRYTHVIIYLSQPTECTAEGISPDVNCGL